jgi:hypothetical protein
MTNKLAAIGLFIASVWILFGILSLGLVVPFHGPVPTSGYAVGVHNLSEGDEADEL